MKKYTTIVMILVLLGVVYYRQTYRPTLISDRESSVHERVSIRDHSAHRAGLSSSPATQQSSRQGEVRTGSDDLIVSDSTWQGVYGREADENSDSREWLSSEYGLFSFMGIHAADVGIAYQSGDIVIDLYKYLIHFPVDAATFVIYEGKYDPSYSENMHASVIPFPIYDECPDMVRIPVSGGETENPLRCFAEDKNYIYAWREYPVAGGGGYELVREKK